MKGLFSTAYFPPVSYMSAIIKCAGIAIEAEETYLKQSYRNRCIIQSANGLQNLIVPVKRPEGNRSKTKIIYPDYSTNWPVQHLRSLHAAYKASPYYDYYIPYFEQILLKKWDTLLALNQAVIQEVMRLLKISIPLSTTTTFEKKTDQFVDFRAFYNPKKPFTPELFYEYYQVFGEKFPFQPDLSVIDLLFNEGPQSLIYLQNLKLSNPDKQS